MPAPRPLYNLPAILKADPDEPIFVLEGEKATDAALRCGLVATTSSGGAQAAGKTDWSPMRNRHVVILPDGDEPGERFATDAARLCREAGVKDVRILRLADHAPGLPAGGDLADILESAEWCKLPLGDAATPEDLGRWLRAAAERVEPLQSEPTKPELSPGPVTVCLADVRPEPIRWLWENRVPSGRLTLLVGAAGCGKSLVTTDMAARVSTGRPWPDGAECPQGSVLLLLAEDNPADTVRPRLDAAGADVRRVHLLQAVRYTEQGATHERVVTLADIDAIEQALKAVGDVKLLIVDPIGSYLGADTDAHRDNEVRGVLGPLALLGEKFGTAIVVVAHRRKSPAIVADDMAIGARAFTGLARAVWHLSADPNDKERRLLLAGKNNLAKPQPGLAFRIAGDVIPHLAWESDPVMLDADAVLAMERSPRGPRADSRGNAEEWLAAALADGPRLAKELVDDWVGGQCGSERTLRRARAALDVVAFRREVPGPWWWRLKDQDEGGQDGQSL